MRGAWLRPSVFCALALTLGGCGQGSSTGPAPQQSPTVRTYYIAADEVAWNYVPTGINQISGKPFTGMEVAYAVHAPNHIGPIYHKAMYREYTDETFRTLKVRPPDQQYLGLLGPIIHAEVGDTIKVVFKNNASRPYSIHPHGVFYKKDSEGVAYHGDRSPADLLGAAVPPGHVYTYTWDVPERAGPGPGDPSSIVWLYHSHTNDERDIESGLVGAIIVTRRGMARPDGTPKDVDREFVTSYDLINENQSWYLSRNIADYTPTIKGPLKLQSSPIDETGALAVEGTGFADANFKLTINGYLYGNGPMMVMKKGDRVRWYVVSIGNGFNFHTPHWHGNTVLDGDRRTDVLIIGPAQMITVDMVPDNPGIWLYHCHATDHMHAGMSALYEVDT